MTSRGYWLRYVIQTLPASAELRHETKRHTDAHKRRNQGQRLRPTTCDACSLATFWLLPFNATSFGSIRATRTPPPSLCSLTSPLPPPCLPTPHLTTHSPHRADQRWCIGNAQSQRGIHATEHPETTHRWPHERYGTAASDTSCAGARAHLRY